MAIAFGVLLHLSEFVLGKETITIRGYNLLNMGILLQRLDKELLCFIGNPALWSPGT